MVNVSVIVPTYKRIQQTLRTIRLLSKSRGIGYDFLLEIIVADSTPDESLERALVTEFGDTVIYIHPPKRGISINKNSGAKISKGDILIFCDSDIEVEPDTIVNTIKAMQNYPTAASITGKVYWKNGTHDGFLDRPRKEDRLLNEGRTMYVEAIYSRYMATYADIFKKVGGYDEEVFNMRGEGSDLSVRYWRAGYPLVYDESVIVHHVYDAPDSIALRVGHPEWGVAKDYVLLAYKYSIIEDFNEHFINTVAENFKSLGERGYFAIIQSIVVNIDTIVESKMIIDEQKKKMKSLFDFKHLEIFSDKKTALQCINDAENQLKQIRSKIFPL